MLNKKNKSKRRRSLRRRRNVKSRKVMRGGFLDGLKPKTGKMQIYKPNDHKKLFLVDIEYTENEKEDHKEIKIYKIKNEDPEIENVYNTKPLVIRVEKKTGTDEIYELKLTQEAIQIYSILDRNNERYFIKGIQ